ncbi:MAG TPA: NAD(P)H-dependent oxidoreductase [Burkholderiales bacterium]|nr:NAD(P)H-dependent oxidoreductase [Burkholderiales bacterium]
MKFAIISGSTRKNSQSSKVARYVKFYLESQQQDTYFLNLAEQPIKHWNETFWNDYENFDPIWNIARKELQTSDAIIVISPEWNGMCPPALKNVFQLATKGEFANKPALIISVSASTNGVYPIAELRLNTYKNTYICYIPQHVIVRNVNKVLNSFENSESEEDTSIRKRIIYSVQLLKVYAEAFTNIRKNDIVLSNTYPYGM